MLQRGLKLEIGSGTLAVGPITVSTENLVAENPQYEGFSKEGGRYLVKAKTAEQDIRQTGPIRLTTIDGTFTEANRSNTYLTATRGTFDTKGNVLELMERIDITGDSGLRAALSQATVFTKEGRIVSSAPVAVTMPTGTVVGNEMEMLQKQKQISFSKGVKTRLFPANANQGQGAPQAPVRQQAGAAGGHAMGTLQSGPVDITSERLDIDDAAKIATFRGDVLARQGEAVVQAPIMQATYDGAAPGATAAPAAATDGKLKQIFLPEPFVMTQGGDRVTARKGEFDVRRETGTLTGDVVVTSGADGRATGDRADIDNKTDTVVLAGNVVVSQGRNILKGRRLDVDRRSGRSQLASPADGTLPRGRITARFYQAAAPAGAKEPPKKAAPKPASEQDPLMMAFQSDPNTPIDIESDVLDNDDKAKTATFRGQVRAVQGDYTITAAELIATYSGETGLGLTPQAGSAAAAAPTQKGQGAQLQKVTAKQKVLVLSKDGTSASGDTADFDTKANTIVLTSNVTLTQHGGVTTCDKAIFNMTSGIANCLDDGGQAPGATKSRPVFMGFPDQMKDAQQKKKAESPTVPKSGPAAAPAPRAVQPKASSWGAQTTVGPQ
jgi:lipopolysaccharide transport protein LptA/LPS export ABC transporter protein LptC